VYFFHESGNLKCPFCNADEDNKTEEERVQEMMRRVEANDSTSICMLATHYRLGRAGFQQDHVKAMELYVRAADLGFNKAHYLLGMLYHEGGNLKKARFHFEAAAMLGDELARNNLGSVEFESGNMERAVTHWTIGASGGDYLALNKWKICFGKDYVSRVSIDSTLAAYISSCAEMRSEARDAYIRFNLETM
jgi:tetratricopeptide (TPR) repeat protein